LQGIREIYVADGNVDGYFAYAEKAGVECDTSVMARDSLSFAAARRIYLSGDTATAEKSLRSYLRNYPKGYYTDDALFYLSDCHLKAKQTDAAIETLSELAARPTNQYSARTLGTLSKLTSEAGRHAEAAKAYRALYDVVQTADERAAAATGYFRSVEAGGDDAAHRWPPPRRWRRCPMPARRRSARRNSPVRRSCGAAGSRPRHCRSTAS